MGQNTNGFHGKDCYGTDPNKHCCGVAMEGHEVIGVMLIQPIKFIF